MRKINVFILTIFFIGAGTVSSYASDWDKAGKILTAIEGIRILTGDRVDVVGAMIGGVQGRHSDIGYRKSRKRNHHKHSAKCSHRRYHRNKRKYRDCIEKVWVPHYEWNKKHIPEHEEYDDQLGTVYVEEHYIKYKVQNGGHWETVDRCY